MKVVEVVRGLGLGGAEMALVRRLAFQPADVETIVVSTAPWLDHFNDDVSSRCRSLKLIRPRAVGQGGLAAMIADLEPDLVVVHAPRDTIRVLASGVPTATPVVVMAHAPTATQGHLLEPAVAAGMRLLNGRAALHIAVSQSAAEGAQCRGARRVRVQPLGGDGPSPDTQALDIWPADTHFRFLSLGRLVKFKNVDGLLRAVSQLPEFADGHASLAVVGVGPEADHLAQLVQEYHLEGCVSLYGATTSPNALLLAADYLIVSSLFEGGPITVFEALLSGSRVISTPVGVSPTVLAPDAMCILTGDCSDMALAGAIRDALRNPPVSVEERSRRMEAAAIWNPSQSAASFYSVLREALE